MVSARTASYLADNARLWGDGAGAILPHLLQLQRAVSAALTALPDDVRPA